MLKEYSINDLSGGSVGVEISNDMKYIYSSNEAIKKYNFSIPTSVSTEPQVTRIIPNPTSGFVTINTNCLIPQIQYSITNINGQIISSSIVQNTNNQIKLNFSQYPNGIYNIMLHCNQNISNFKIIKE